MKTIVRNLAKVTVKAAVLSLAIGLSHTANAQSVRLPGEEISTSTPNSTQSLVLATELDSRALNAQSMDAATTKRAAVGSTSLSLAAELPKAVDQALSMISIANLSKGETKATVVVGGSTSILDEQGINVKVNYEARPVGGILTVRVSMAPTFRGVGVSTRPVITRSVAMAVDELDEAMVQDMVRNLSSEINAEYAHN
jgi:hypothetical protein